MITLAHIVNPVSTDPSSDLFVAQPITFETMRRARSASSAGVAVTLVSAQYPEDRSAVPADFELTRDLDRSLRDILPTTARKLPFIRDILDRLLEASEADYFIYTNVDIGVQAEFYDRVADRILAGTDCFALRRRNLSGEFRSVTQIPEMYEAAGTLQRSADCFVFPRELCARFRLDEIVVGEPGIARALLCNLLRHARRPDEDLGPGELTFHIGNDGAWRAHPSEAGRLNVENSLAVVEALYDETDDEQNRAHMEPHLEALERMASGLRARGV